MTDVFRQALGSISGGSVLDVATQEGGFIRVLADNLRDYSALLGVDIDPCAIAAAQNAFAGERGRFLVMDGEYLAFAAESFDTVAISASLHHIREIQSVLKEMKRVLRQDGHLIMAEMHRDGRTDAQLTTIHLHHWLAAVDGASGNLHNPTLSRQELIDYVESLHLHNMKLYDFSDTNAARGDEAGIRRLEELIDENIRRAENWPDGRELRTRGEALRRRLHETGFQREPVLVVTGVKR